MARPSPKNWSSASPSAPPSCLPLSAGHRRWPSCLSATMRRALSMSATRSSAQPHAGGGCAFNFVAHINGACRVLTNKNHGQCRRAANLRRQRLGFNGDTCHQIFRESLAVDHFCFCHKTPPRASIWNVFGCSWRGHRQPAIHFASPPIRLRRNSAPSSRMTGLISMPPRSGIKRRTRPSSGS